MFDIVLSAPKPPACPGGGCGLGDVLANGGAAVGAVIAGAMAIVAFFLKIAVEAGVESARRARRRQEILSALKSEVQDSLKNYHAAYAPAGVAPDDSRHPRSVSKARFAGALATGEAYIPFVTVVPSDFMWEQIRPDLAMVEPTILDEATRYYYAERLLNQRLLDLRSDDYKALPIARQDAVMTQVYDLFVPQLLASGEALVAAIDASKQQRKSRADVLGLKAIVFVALAALTLLFAAALL